MNTRNRADRANLFALINNPKTVSTFLGKNRLPLIMPPSSPLGGSGGGIAYNREVRCL